MNGKHVSHKSRIGSVKALSKMVLAASDISTLEKQESQILSAVAENWIRPFMK